MNHLKLKTTWLLRSGMLAFVLFTHACDPLHDPNIVCDPKRPPAKPSHADSSTNKDYNFVLRSMVFVKGQEANSVGYDLDGYCSNNPDRPRVECPAFNFSVDGPNGIDNNLSSFLFSSFPDQALQIENTAAASIPNGYGSPAINIEGWNEEANDPNVTVSIYRTIAVVGRSASLGEPQNITFPQNGDIATGDDAAAPSWLGFDYAYLWEDSFKQDQTTPDTLSASAYVRDGKLYAFFPDANVVFGRIQWVQLSLQGLIVEAELVFENNLWQLKNTLISGRWAVNSIGNSAASLGICGVTEDTFKTFLLPNADLYSNINDIGSGKPCDAMSFAFKFPTSSPVRFATRRLEGPPRPNPNDCVMFDAGMDGGNSDAGVDSH